MKARIVRLLLRIVRWLSPPDDAVIARARVLTAEWETRLGPGFGEAKRHQVYARLLKDFPALEKRVVSRAIEEALA